MKSRLFIKGAAFLVGVLFSAGCSKWFSGRIQDVAVPLEAVDLGLPSGTLWASQNLLSDRPWGVGKRFRWGETEVITDSLAYRFIVDDHLIAYNSDEDLGVVDGRYILDPEDDAASNILGDQWRMPTKWDFNELKNYCDWEERNIKGIVGVEIKSRVNSNSIFLPGYESNGWLWGGVGVSYWTSCAAEGQNATSISGDNFTRQENERSMGLYIRPVLAGRDPVERISLKDAKMSFTPGQDTIISVRFTPSDALDRRIDWVLSNDRVAYIDKDNNITALFPGSTHITARSPSSSQTAEADLTVTDFIVPDRIDMGLPSGTLWADCNLGAIEKDTYGLRFAWGEICPRMEFSMMAYYGDAVNNGIAVDFLSPEQDAAAVILGPGWRIPSPADFIELASYCYASEDFSNSRIYIMELESKINGNKLRFPLSHNYWTSEQAKDCSLRNIKRSGSVTEVIPDINEGYYWWWRLIRPVFCQQ